MTYPTGRIDPEVMNTIPPEIAQWIFQFRADDIKAVWNLVNLAEGEHFSGNTDGAAILFSAQRYLSDRAEYERQFIGIK